MDIKRNKILVIDDNIGFLNMLESIFEIINTDSDIEILYFTDHLELLKYYRDHTSEIGLVLSDFDMPNMNGFELYDRLLLLDRLLLPDQELRFILMTGGGLVDLDLFALKDNVVAVYNKPMESVVHFAEEVLSLIKNWVWFLNIFIYKDSTLISWVFFNIYTIRYRYNKDRDIKLLGIVVDFYINIVFNLDSEF